MKIAVKKLCELLQSSVEVSVYEYTLPDEFVGTGVVVNEVSYDNELDEAQYTVSIYAPDMEKIEAIADKILPLLDNLWELDFNGWVHKRELLSEGNMHFLAISLILQFN